MIGLNHAIRTRLTFSLLLLCVGAPVTAQQPDTAAERRTHVVRRGDTLWDIAGQYLRDPFQWPRIFDLNRSRISDPDLIYPEQRFVLPGFMESATALLGVPVEWPPVAEVEAEGGAEADPEAGEGAGVSLAVDLRRPFMLPAEYRATPWMARPADVSWAGRVTRVADPSRQGSRLPTMLRQFEQVHVGDLQRTVVAGDTLQIVKVHDSVDEYGQILQPVAMLVVDSMATDVAIATVARLYDVAREGDAVVTASWLPVFPRGEPLALPESVSGAEGRVIDWLEKSIVYGTPDIAFVNVGEGEVMLGDELEVYVPERRANARGDIAPVEVVGVVQVVRVSGGVATVRVVEVENTAFARGLPVRVIRRLQ